MDGVQLLDASHDSLSTLGITSKLQRMQLLNRRDELLIMAESQQDASLGDVGQVRHFATH
jgi:hypothetical protein